jgi:hypothetical protein
MLKPFRNSQNLSMSWQWLFHFSIMYPCSMLSFWSSVLTSKRVQWFHPDVQKSLLLKYSIYGCSDQLTFIQSISMWSALILSFPSLWLSLQPVSAGFLLGLLLNLEDGINVLFWNIRLCMNYSVTTQKALLFKFTNVADSSWYNYQTAFTPSFTLFNLAEYLLVTL